MGLVESRLGIRGRHRVSIGMTDADFDQPKCAYCGKPIHDDRLNANYCRPLCALHARSERLGQRRVGKRGQYVNSPWRKYYDRARQAGGQWIEVRLKSIKKATTLRQCCNNTKDLEALRTGSRVSIRKRAA